jgi:hypothetical protein
MAYSGTRRTYSAISTAYTLAIDKFNDGELSTVMVHFDNPVTSVLFTVKINRGGKDYLITSRTVTAQDVIYYNDGRMQLVQGDTLKVDLATAEVTTIQVIIGK